MRKLALLAITVLVASLSFSQKIKVKKDMIFVDGMEYMTFDREMDGGNFQFTFYNLDGEEIAYANGAEYFDDNKISSSNNNGRVYYYTVKIEGLEDFYEISNPINMKKKMAKAFYKAGIYMDNKLDLEKAQKLTLRKGKPHSKRIEQIEAAKKPDNVIIIEKEDSKPSLININL